MVYLCVNFTADYLGVKPVLPAYLRPGLTQEDLLTGVSFASGGSGFDPLTPIVVVITSILWLSKISPSFKIFPFDLIWF